MIDNNFSSGQNMHGVEIDTLLLNIDTSQYDNTTNNSAWSFETKGADSKADRTTDVRNGFAYFADQPASSTPGQLGSSLRRRLVVLQGVPGGRNAAGDEITQWTILYNSNSPNTTAIRDVINSVHPAPAAQTYEQWKTTQNLPVGKDGPFQDADDDGFDNLLEFYAGTSATDATDSPAPSFTPASGSSYQFTFRRAKNITGVEMKLSSSPNLAENSWQDVTMTPSNTNVTDMGDYELVTVTLNPTGERRFYRIELTESE